MLLPVVCRLPRWLFVCRTGLLDTKTAPDGTNGKFPFRYTQQRQPAVPPKKRVYRTTATIQPTGTALPARQFGQAISGGYNHYPDRLPANGTNGRYPPYTIRSQYPYATKG